MTHTFVVLEISPETYAEIYQKLLAANYNHAFSEDTDGHIVIDMHGIALKEQHED